MVTVVTPLKITRKKITITKIKLVNKPVNIVSDIMINLDEGGNAAAAAVAAVAVVLAGA